MNKTILNIAHNFQKYIFVFATVILVLLSSCAVRASVRALTGGIPHQTEQGTTKEHHNLKVNSVDKCAEIENANILIVQKVSFGANDLLPTFFVTASFLFLIRVGHESKERKHPLYSGSSKIRGSVPIFLEYQKLLIYFSH